MEPGYKYLASPYTHPDPLVREYRYLAALDALNTLLGNRILTYSPIVHNHPLAKMWGLPGDAAFWLEFDTAMVRASAGIFVLRLDGWAKSVGVAGEIKLASELNKSITYLMPGSVLDAAATCTIHQDRTEPPAEGV